MFHRTASLSADSRRLCEPYGIDTTNGRELAIDACRRSESFGLWGGDGADGRRIGKRGAFGVDGSRVIGAETELFEGAGVGHELGLPSLVGLKLLHGRLRCGVPLAVGFTGKVMLTDESLLNLSDASRLDGLLSVQATRCPGGRFVKGVGTDAGRGMARPRGECR